MNQPVENAVTDAAEPQFLLSWNREDDHRRWFRAGLFSAFIHLLMGFAGVYLLNLPPEQTKPPERLIVRNVTPLIAPRLTQTEPNKREVSKEFNLESLAPHDRPTSVASPGASDLPTRRSQRFTPPTPTRSAVPSPVIPEAPAIDTGQLRATNAPPPALGAPQAPPVPKIQPEEKPKIAFENPGSPNGATVQGANRLPSPLKTNVQDAMQSVVRSKAKGTTIVDEEEAVTGIIAGSRPSAMPGKLGSSLELVSDPMGVDFRPYLTRVLAAVRRNWYAVIPESARLGRTGKVVIQFAISKDGSVPKLVIAEPSGADPLDRAAVAGISASNPFPPLPPEFRGAQIRLQLAFDYKTRP